jgi:tetratricopeptide (TPR) repeat protein
MMEELSKTNLDSLDTHDLVSVGVSAYNAKDYPRAEAVFLKAIQRNPWHREARYDLLSTYFALSEKAKDSANALRKAKSVIEAAKMDSLAVGYYKQLAREAQTLLENDPMNIDAMRLLARAYNGLNQEEQAIAIISKAVVLPFTVEVSGFQIGSSKAVLSAEAVGRTPQDATGKAIPTTPVTLVVEFLDLAGKVLDSREITVPALKEGAKHPINLEGTGDAIVGWRYRAKQA